MVGYLDANMLDINFMCSHVCRTVLYIIVHMTTNMTRSTIISMLSVICGRVCRVSLSNPSTRFGDFIFFFFMLGVGYLRSAGGHLWCFSIMGCVMNISDISVPPLAVGDISSVPQVFPPICVNAIDFFRARVYILEYIKKR